MKTILMILLLILPISAFADKSLIMGGFSHHTSKCYKDGAECKPWNESNPLIAIEYNGYFVGEMLNSYNEESTFIGYHHQAKVFGLMGMMSNKYNLSSLPRVGNLVIGGFLTAKAGPLLLLTVPGKVYVITVQLKL